MSGYDPKKALRGTIWDPDNQPGRNEVIGMIESAIGMIALGILIYIVWTAIWS